MTNRWGTAWGTARSELFAALTITAWLIVCADFAIWGLS